jgi:hypothetical protein
MYRKVKNVYFLNAKRSFKYLVYTYTQHSQCHTFGFIVAKHPPTRKCFEGVGKGEGGVWGGGGHIILIPANHLLI